MQSSPNDLFKKLMYLDQGSNDINYFLYIRKYRKFNIIAIEFLCLLATMHPIFLYTKFTFIFNNNFLFLGKVFLGKIKKGRLLLLSMLDLNLKKTQGSNTN